jgi:copper resistance protein C
MLVELPIQNVRSGSCEPRRALLRAFAGVALMSLAAGAHAHTAIKQTTPANNAVLSESPPVIDITFEHRAQLTSVIVVEAGHPQRKLGFEPIGSSTEFRLHEPKLEAGRNELHWKGLSEDGHVIEGTLVFVIAPVAPKNP